MKSEKKYSIQDIELLVKQLSEGSLEVSGDIKNNNSDDKAHINGLLNSLKDIFQNQSNGITKEDKSQLIETNSDESINEYVDGRLEGIINSAMSLAQLDFNSTFEISPKYDSFDALSTALKMLKEELELSTVSRDFLNDMFDSMSAMVIVLDENKTIKWLNLSAQKTLGYSKKDIVGTNFNDFLLVDDSLDQVMDLADQNENDVTPINELSHIRTVNKEIIPIEVSFSNMLLSEGTVLIIQNISDRLNAQNEQERLMEILRNKNKDLRDFAYVLSHDIKSPLRGIATLADWVFEDNKDKLDQDSINNLELIKVRIKRLYGLIEGVFEYSKLGRVAVQKENVSTKNVVNEIIDSLDVSQNITITIDNQLPVIFFVKIHLVQIFQNLISNAIKYNDKSEGLINIGCKQSDSRIEFYVKDNGLGIDEKYMIKIFKIFQTLSAKDDVESTGIGLSIVKKIVKLYGGNIWVESKIEIGSTFFFYVEKQLP